MLVGYSPSGMVLFSVNRSYAAELGHLHDVSEAAQQRCLNTGDGCNDSGTLHASFSGILLVGLEIGRETAYLESF